MKATKKKEKAEGVTIQIYLPSGDPQGIRRAQIMTRTVRVFDVPRNNIGQFFEMPESGQVAVYYLFGDDIEDRRTQCYIGKTITLRDRFRSHFNSEISWSRALIAVSSTDEHFETHVGYLEWRSIKEAKEVERFDVRNKNTGSVPRMSDSLQSDCEKTFRIIKTLLATLGFPLFQKLATAAPKSTDIEVFCKMRGADARGIYSSDGLTVFKGSRCASKPTDLATPEAIYARHTNLLQDGTLALVDGVPIFQRDTLFKSPSGASCIVMFQSSNGWQNWRTEQGVTLNDATGRGSVKKEGKENGA